MATRSFPIADMSPLLLGTTIGYGVLTVVFGAISFYLRPLRPLPMSTIFAALTVLLALGAWAVWLYYRPRRFDVSRGEVAVVWPLRRLVIPKAAISSVRLIPSVDAFRAEFGWGMRVGVGGLWGIFGYLATGRCGKVDIYASRMHPWVLIERVGGRPLIITPSDPEAFVRAAGALVGEAGARHA